MNGRSSDGEIATAGQQLAADALDLRSFTTHVSYDTSVHRDLVGLARTLQRRMVAMLPIVSGLADVLSALSRATEGAQTPAIIQLLNDASAWFESGAALSEDKRAQFLAAIAQAEIEAAGMPQWQELLVHNVIARVRDLIQIWGDCIDLKQDIVNGSHHELRWRRFGMSLDNRPMHRDYGMAFYSSFAAMLATFIATAFWVLSGWSQGNAAPMMAGVLCCLFATMDDPTPMMKQFLYASIAAVAGGFILEFGVFPAVHDYWTLVAALGLVLIPVGTLMAKPQTMLLGMGFGVNLPNMLGLQGRLSLDLASFLNSNVALIVGLVIACGTAALVRSVGAEWSAFRLLRAGWADISAAARKPQGTDMTALLHRMVDRLGLIAPRLAALPADSAAVQNDVLKDLRNGLNTVELQRHKQQLSRPARMAIDDVLSALAAFYQWKQRKAETAPDADLLQTLDHALAALEDGGSSDATEGARRALTGLRYALFPDARGFAANENRPTAKPDEQDLKEHAA
jgi:uncharacterized membrane protein YccC